MDKVQWITFFQVLCFVLLGIFTCLFCTRNKCWFFKTFFKLLGRIGLNLHAISLFWCDEFCSYYFFKNRYYFNALLFLSCFSWSSGIVIGCEPYKRHKWVRFPEWWSILWDRTITQPKEGALRTLMKKIHQHNSSSLSSNFSGALQRCRNASIGNTIGLNQL